MALPLLLAAAAVIGVTDNPCPAPVAMSPALETWQKSAYGPGVKAMPAPPAEAAAYVAAYNEARKKDWADLCRYRQDDLRLRALPQAEREVVFMGDSITHGWGLADKALFSGGRINRGISGQTTQQMLLRFPQDVIALHPRVVHIMAGTNDIAGNTGPTTFDAIEGNVSAMVVLAKAAGIRVVLAATPPAAVFSWAPNLRPAPQIVELNQRFRRLAVRERVTFVDYASVLATPEGGLRAEFTFDGVHPNAAGYAAMAPVLANALKAPR